LRSTTRRTNAIGKGVTNKRLKNIVKLADNGDQTWKNWQTSQLCAYVRDIAYAVRQLRKRVKELEGAHVDLFNQHVGLGISHDDLEMNVGAIAGILDEHLEAEEIDGETAEAEFKVGDKVVLAYEDDELGDWDIPEDFFGQVATVVKAHEDGDYSIEFETGNEFLVTPAMIERIQFLVVPSMIDPDVEAER
jgi:hypothetical protein